jgi:hypothetical protein
MKALLLLFPYICAISLTNLQADSGLQSDVASALQKDGTLVNEVPQEQSATDSMPSASAVFAPPAGWHLADEKVLPKNVPIMVIGSGKGNFPPSINLAIEPYRGSIKQYLQLVKSINEKKGNSWKDLGKIQTKAGEGSLSQIETKINGEEVRMMHTIVAKDGTVYILTATATKEEFPSLYKPFFDAMSSFDIIQQPLEAHVKGH